MEPYYSDDRATLYRADALAVLRELPTASVDALVTDPPYSSGGMVRGDRMATTGLKYAAHAERLNHFSGDNRDQRSFGLWAQMWLGESLRVVKEGGLIICFTDWRQLPTMTDCIQIAGWVWRGIVPWAKPDARPQLGRFVSACEYALWGSNGQMPKAIKAEGARSLPGFYQARAPRDRLHQTQKPQSVMAELLEIVPVNGIVLDPFAGSGTTGVAAVMGGRRFIGIEMTEHYVEVAANRLRTVERGYRDDGEQGALELDGEAS